MQPKIKSKVVCTDREVGEVTRVIVDPLTKEISHVVVMAGEVERMVPVAGNVSAVTGEAVRLNCPSDALSNFERFQRGEFVGVNEVEIAHLERHLDVTPGEILVPLPLLERDLSRRSFFTRFTNAIGAVLALPLVFPVFKYITQPMYQPFDNGWIKLGRVEQLGQVDTPRLIKFRKSVQEGFLKREYEKSHWVIKASPELREKIYAERGAERGMEFRNPRGDLIWENRPETDLVVLSGKCPHLGCAFRWRKHRTFGQAFVCPCHLSIFDPSGKTLDGPSPRPLDVLPVKVSGSGEIQIIDMEFKAGKKEQVRIV